MVKKTLLSLRILLKITLLCSDPFQQNYAVFFMFCGSVRRLWFGIIVLVLPYTAFTPKHPSVTHPVVFQMFLGK